MKDASQICGKRKTEVPRTQTHTTCPEQDTDPQGLCWQEPARAHGPVCRHTALAHGFPGGGSQRLPGPVALGVLMLKRMKACLPSQNHPCWFLPTGQVEQGCSSPAASTPGPYRALAPLYIEASKNDPASKHLGTGRVLAGGRLGLSE